MRLKLKDDGDSGTNGCRFADNNKVSACAFDCTGHFNISAQHGIPFEFVHQSPLTTVFVSGSRRSLCGQGSLEL